MGGSDQWGNITAGVELIRKADRGEAFALVCPLLTTASGQKMGKTEGNSVWLDPALTSPFDFYQYWINVDDADAARLLRLYTFLPEARVDELTATGGAALREAKRVLAFEATALTHGPEAAEAAQAAADALFGGAARGAPDDAEVPTTQVAATEVEAEITLAELFVRSGLCASRGDARRQAAQGGLSVDDRRVDDVDVPFRPAGRTTLLRRGKRHYHRIRIV
jgi:tyrosyl-tRNA synthetase